MPSVSGRVVRKGIGFGGAAKQVAYATMRALNATDNEMQAQVRASLLKNFIVRKPSFINRMVKIKAEDRATKTRLKARLRVEGPEGSEDRGGILTRHEVDAIHTKATTSPYATDNYFYIPTEVIRFPASALVPQSLYPRNLRLQTRKDVTGELSPTGRLTRKNTIQLQGKRRTFVLNRPGTETPLGIFQRKEGRGGKSRPHDIALIWYFTKRVHLKPRLHFGETTTATYTERFKPNFQAAFTEALRTAR